MSNIYNGQYRKSPVAKATEPIKGMESKMKANNGGGVSFFNNSILIDRFLIIGITGNTYYATKKQVAENAFDIIAQEMSTEEGAMYAVKKALEVSVNGLGLSNDPCLVVFSLGMVSNFANVKKFVRSNFSKVVRTGTDILHMGSFVDSRRGWGRSIRGMFSDWMNLKTVDNLAFQMAKYQNRDGWAWKDIIRLAHVGTEEPDRLALYYKFMGKDFDRDKLPGIVNGIIEINSPDVTEIVALGLIAKYRMPMDMVPNRFRGPAVWEASLPNMGITAIMRNVGNMSKNMTNKMRDLILNALSDENRLRKGRVHPFKMYIGWKTYANGHGTRSDSQWTVDRHIVSTMEEAIYKCFRLAEPTGKKYMFGLDCSGSMTMKDQYGVPDASPIDAETIITLSLLEAGDDVEVYRFHHILERVDLRKGMTIAQAINKIYDGGYGKTDASLLFNRALTENKNIDAFVTMTDNEINMGYQPQYVLENYRQKVNANAKSVVLGMTVTELSIADPNDPLSMDVAGMSADVPQVIANFVGGSSIATDDESE